MSLPGASVKIEDFALGTVKSTGNVIAVLGISTAGDADTIYSIASANAARDVLQSGPLAECAAFIAGTTGALVLAVPMNASIAGVISGVNEAKTGSGSIATGGAPLDVADVTIQITQTGEAGGNAAFKYSIDGGDTWSAELALLTTAHDLGVGITVTASNSTPDSFVKGDKFTFTATAPGSNLTDINNALTALMADSRPWRLVYIDAEVDSVAGVSVDSAMTTAKLAGRYAYALLNANDQSGGETEAQWIAGLLAEWSGFAASSRAIEVAAGACEITSQLSKRIDMRPRAWLVAAKEASVPLKEAIGRFRSGPLTGVVRLKHNEDTTPGLHDARFVTLRTYPTVSGFYVTGSPMMAPSGSDYGQSHFVRVMNRVAEVGHAFALRYVLEDLRVDEETGLILETEARDIEAQGEEAVRRALGDAINAVQVVVDRTENILQTGLLKLTYRVQRLAYSEFVEVTVAYATGLE